MNSRDIGYISALNFLFNLTANWKLLHGRVPLVFPAREEFEELGSFYLHMKMVVLF